MYILLTDETNRNPGQRVKFFVYGGLFFKASELEQINNSIINIRAKYGFRQDDVFKFNSNSKPSYISKEKFSKAKDDVLSLCIETDCRFIAYVIHHRIANPNTRLSYAADHVIGRYNYFLEKNNAKGMCLIDPFPIKGGMNYIRRKFRIGLSVSGSTIPLNNVLLFGDTCIGASHISTAMDVVLGSFRYCINNPQNTQAAKAIFSKITKLMWHERRGNILNFAERGLILRPKVVSVGRYKSEYDELISSIKELLKKKV